YLHGEFGDRMRHVAYFLSPITRECFASGCVDLVPSNFSEVPLLMRELERPLVVASVSPPDRHGYVSLGTNCDYASSLIGHADFFVEANQQMPRTFGRGQIHLSQVAGWCEADYPLVAPAPVEPSAIDHRIGGLVAERIPHGATIQTGIGGMPNAVLAALGDHRNLGVHTELLSDGLIDLVENGVVTGVDKVVNRTKIVGTFALGTRRLYDFLHENAAVELWPVRYVNNPRVIGQEPGFVSINATLEVDLLGQCASESLGSRMWSGSGGQADFARGAMYSPGGQGFIVAHATAHGGQVSRIVSQLTPGAAVTTIKNTVDKVVTEYGVAELRGRTIAERAAAMIAIAHPEHRQRLYDDAVALNFVRPGSAIGERGGD
ncbi:MAG: acetyl-CoA hydrolase/transferase family protein, partial [Acidimicrobiales bacterium]|nr:acetyl-CoA hydrolase/transferase family protein [Acidimicrobiales bacterium]